MRMTVTIVATVVAGAVSWSAAAEPYLWRDQHRKNARGAWCLDSPDGGPYDCGYASLQQCQTARAGVGGSCNPNPRYVAAQKSSGKKTTKTRRY